MLVDTAAPFPISQSARRLATGLALSIALHALIVLGIVPTPYRITAPVPLQVELQRVEAPPPTAEVAAEPLSEFSAAAAAETPQEAPPTDTPAPAVVPEAPVAVDQPLETYFTARELDARAELINQVDLVYPVNAYEMRLHGRVVVRIFINEHGAVDETSVLEATPPGIFEEAALAATQALQFRPAQKYGRNVKSQKTIEVTFDPYESIRPR
jgi:protein TonB